MAKRLLLLLACVVFLLFRVHGQNSSVTGVIKDAVKNQPVPFATVMLTKAADSVLVKGAVSDSNGTFGIENISAGSYILLITYAGMVKNYSKPFSLSDNENYNAPTILLSPSPNTLNQVDISAKKPLFEQKPGMTIVNVGSSITSVGDNALEVLQKSPGVLVDNNNNISLKGKSGVTVMIDDKPTYLSATDLANLLKNIPASSIDQIELMTIPPAKYDAAGSAGIINIKLKKNTVLGLNGSVTAGFKESIYANYRAALNLNYRTSKVNLFCNYAYNNYYAFSNNLIIRRFSDSGSINSIFNESAQLRFPGTTNSIKVGADYYLDKNNTIGVMVNGIFNNEYDKFFSVTDITNAGYTPQSSDNSYSSYKNNLNSVTYDLNYKSKLDTSGTTLSANLDYAQFNNTSLQNFLTNYFDAYGNPVYPQGIMMGNIPSTINISSVKVDFEHPFKHGFILQAGIKSSYVTSDNNVQYQDFENDEWVNDTGATNHFKYTENINAAYIDLSKDFKKGWSVEAGLRGEQTVSKGDQLTIDSSFAKNYLQLFPSLFIKKDIGKDNEFTLSYARRIDRPNYQDLNPFRYFVDPYTYIEGNPYLQPQITNDLELSHIYKNFLTTTLSVSQTTNAITDVLNQIDSTKTTFQTKDNLSTFNNIGISVSAPVPVFKWWTSNDYVNVFYNQYEGKFLNGNLNLGIVSWSVNSENEFTFPKGFSFELNVNYNGPFLYGIFEGKINGSVSIGIEKSLWSNRASIKASFNDIFYTDDFIGTVNYEDINTSITDKYGSRNVGLAFTYHFGNVSHSNHSTGIEDEKKRVKEGRGAGGS